MKKIVLASTSPRRRQLMTHLGLPFKAVDSHYREVHHKHLKPEALVKFLALGKAEAVAKKYPKAIIIGADTIVVHNKKIYGKPKNKTEARWMLKKFSGTRHEVVTGLCVLDSSNGKKFVSAVKLKVYFRELNRKGIDNYIAVEQVLDKAGAYAVQGLGMGLIKKVEGELTNGMGLPLETLSRMLKKFGIIGI